MEKIILMAETGSDIPPKTAAEYGIHIVPMHISFGDETRDDGTFPSEEICAYYERTGTLPKTSASTPEDFTRAFDKIHSRWPEAHILYLAYSAVTTCSFQSAQIAAQGRDYVTSIDTKSVSVGQYAVVTRTARLLKEHPDWTRKQAVSAVQDLVRHVRMGFIPDKLEYLRAGGRVSNATALCGRLLSIHPLIEILDGRLQATKKYRGKLIQIAPRLVSEFAAKNSLKKEELWMIWSPGLPDEVKEAAENAAHDYGCRKITWVKTGGVITAHGGPSAFGIVGFSAGSSM